jgi:hypothetical protein
MNEEIAMHNDDKTCGQCAYFRKDVGCLSFAEGTRVRLLGGAELPACPAFADPNDPALRACQTCARFKPCGPRDMKVRPVRCVDSWKKTDEHSPVRCKRWKAKPVEVQHA